MATLGTGRPAAEFHSWDLMIMRGINKNCEGKEDVVNPIPVMLCTTSESSYDLSVALNYGYSGGSPQPLRFITEHFELIHDPPYGN